jgi:predicted Fe-S protein YdhL (DUF1289 family)
MLRHLAQAGAAAPHAGQWQSGAAGSAHALQDRSAVTFQTAPMPVPVETGAADVPVASAPVPSPCVLVCLYDKDLDACRGCFRSLDEIAHWSIYDPDEQRAVLERVAERRSRSDAQAPG